LTIDKWWGVHSLIPEAAGAPLADPNGGKRAERTHYQAMTDSLRAELGTTDLMIASHTGPVDHDGLFTSGVPKSTALRAQSI